MRLSRFSKPPGRALLLVAAALVVALAVAACSPVKVLNRIVSKDTYEFEGGIAYGDQARQRLDVYRPLAPNAQSEGARPLVVFFYGGTWTTGERGEYRFVGEALASRGAVVVVADYRLSPRVTYPAFVRDSAKAVKWALDNAQRLGADPNRIYVMGHSSGGYNAAMVALDARWLGALGTSPKKLAGWIGLAGPYDFLPIINPDAKVAFNWPNTPPDSQPLAQASAESPPALLLAAADDQIVNPKRSTGQMADKLRAAGVPVQKIIFDDLGHMTLIAAAAGPLEWLGGPVLPPILEFLGLAQPPAGRAVAR